MSTAITSLSFMSPDINCNSTDNIDPSIKYKSNSVDIDVEFMYEILESNACTIITNPQIPVTITSYDSNFSEPLKLVKNEHGSLKEMTLQISVVGNESIKATTKLICQ